MFGTGENQLKGYPPDLSAVAAGCFDPECQGNSDIGRFAGDHSPVGGGEDWPPEPPGSGTGDRVTGEEKRRDPPGRDDGKLYDCCISESVGKDLTHMAGLQCVHVSEILCDLQKIE